MTTPADQPASHAYNTWPAEEWLWRARFRSDVGFDAFEAEVNVKKFDWNLAVWWNTDLAEVTRVYTQEQVIGRLWDPFEPVRTSLQLSGGFDTFLSIVSRLPRTETRCAEQLAAALHHVVKVNATLKPPEWAVYDYRTGRWRSEDEEGVGASVTDCVLQFGHALGRAVDAALAMRGIVEPDPGPKPEVGSPLPDGSGVMATAADVVDWERATEKRDAMLEAIKPATAMYRSIFTTKYEKIRKELKLRVAVTGTAWDSDMRWIVLRDGAINVEEVYQGKGVTLYPHSPKHMSTMALDVAWEDEVRNAGKSEWELGVEKVLPDAEVRRYLQKRFGAALLGKPGVAGKSMVWQHGPGDTAKSTLQECIAGSHGVFAPYAIVSTADALTEKGSAKGEAERFKAYARGKRYVLMSELADAEMLNQAVLKSVTGGETVQGTAKYSNAVSYFFTATIFMASNHPPTFPPGDTALKGRITVFPFNHRLWIRSKNPKEWEEAGPEHRADENWADRIRESKQERRAILAWVLEGLEAFGAEGLGDLPEAMQEAAEEFAADADPVGRLVRTLLGTEPGWEANGWLRICTDQEWEEEGRLERDGLETSYVNQLIQQRGRELGMVKLGETELSQRWTRAALRMIHELGGKKKKAMLDPVAKRTGFVFSRLTMVAPANDISGIVQDM